MKPVSEDMEGLDAETLTNLVTNPDQPPAIHRKAFDQLMQVNATERRRRLIVIMQSMVRYPAAYDEELKMATVELLGTDPHPDATVAMVEVLPDILSKAITSGDELSSDFRDYYYRALITRAREADLAAWSRLLPQLDARTLVATLIDPIASPLQELEPMTLIDRLGEPLRTQSLFSGIIGLAQNKGAKTQVQQAAHMLERYAEPAQLEEGLSRLEDLWNRATRHNQPEVASRLEAALAILDKRPRTAAERLRRRRPWAE